MMNWCSPKLRRRLLIVLLLSALAAFGYVRKEIFFQQAKKALQNNLGKSLSCRFSIGDIRIGRFHNLILEDLELAFPQGQNPALEIKVKEARVAYNLWEAIFSTNLKTGKDFVLLLQDGQISVNRRPWLKNLQGRLIVRQNDLYFQNFRARVSGAPANKVKLYGQLVNDELSLTASLEHFKVNNYDLLTNLNLTLNKKSNPRDKTFKISGALTTYGSVLNNRPLPELNSSFEIQDNKLSISTFSLGDNYDLRGVVNLNPPFEADLSLNFYQAAPSELVRQFNPELAANFSGLLNGLIKISGELAHPKVEGYLEAKHGRLGDVNFASADISIKGQYPQVSIVEARFLREEGSFLMEGEIDFSNLFKPDTAGPAQGKGFADLKFKADKGIIWQGWDITRGRSSQLHAAKNISDNVKITFETSVDDEVKVNDNSKANELGLEYGKIIKLRLKEDEEILGVEKRVRF